MCSSLDTDSANAATAPPHTSPQVDKGGCWLVLEASRLCEKTSQNLSYSGNFGCPQRKHLHNLAGKGLNFKLKSHSFFAQVICGFVLLIHIFSCIYL